MYIFQFNSNWYLLLIAFLLGWLFIMLFRKKQFDRREAKQQIPLGILGTIAFVCMEMFAVTTNLWNCTPDNWPVILWPTYFIAILFGYQLLRYVEKMV